MEIEQINIHSLPSLKIPERYNLPEIGGIYFVLTEKKDVEYIGKAKNLNKRWRKHECCIDLDSPKTCRVAWIEVSSENERTEFEKQFIRKLNPKHNANFIIKVPQPKPAFIRTDKKRVSDLITTKVAAEKLGVSMRRVLALIKQGRLPSQQFGRDHLIKESDLELVKERKAGRPPKVKGENKE